MSAVITAAPFGNAAAVRGAEAANAAFARAIDLGYCETSARQFARLAKREASRWESPKETALRLVLPMRGTFAGPSPGGFAA